MGGESGDNWGKIDNSSGMLLPEDRNDDALFDPLSETLPNRLTGLKTKPADRRDTDVISLLGTQEITEKYVYMSQMAQEQLKIYSLKSRLNSLIGFFATPIVGGSDRDKYAACLMAGMLPTSFLNPDNSQEALEVETALGEDFVLDGGEGSDTSPLRRHDFPSDLDDDISTIDFPDTDTLSFGVTLETDFYPEEDHEAVMQIQRRKDLDAFVRQHKAKILEGMIQFISDQMPETETYR